MTADMSLGAWSSHSGVLTGAALALLIDALIDDAHYAVVLARENRKKTFGVESFHPRSEPYLLPPHILEIKHLYYKRLSHFFDSIDERTFFSDEIDQIKNIMTLQRARKLIINSLKNTDMKIMSNHIGIDFNSGEVFFKNDDIDQLSMDVALSLLGDIERRHIVRQLDCAEAVSRWSSNAELKKASKDHIKGPILFGSFIVIIYKSILQFISDPPNFYQTTCSVVCNKISADMFIYGVFKLTKLIMDAGSIPLYSKITARPNRDVVIFLGAQDDRVAQVMDKIVKQFVELCNGNISPLIFAESLDVLFLDKAIIVEFAKSIQSQMCDVNGGLISPRKDGLFSIVDRYIKKDISNKFSVEKKASFVGGVVSKIVLGSHSYEDIFPRLGRALGIEAEIDLDELYSLMTEPRSVNSVIALRRVSKVIAEWIGSTHPEAIVPLEQVLKKRMHLTTKGAYPEDDTATAGAAPVFILNAVVQMAKNIVNPNVSGSDNQVQVAGDYVSGSQNKSARVPLSEITAEAMLRLVNEDENVKDEDKQFLSSKIARLDTEKANGETAVSAFLKSLLNVAEGVGAGLLTSYIQTFL